MGLKPTEEQEAIVQAAKGQSDSLMVQAFAGCAKTTTLEMVAKALPGNRQALATAFNVKIKKELEQRFPQNFQVLTLNGLGHRAWGRAIGRSLTLDEKKLGKIVTEVQKEQGYRGQDSEWIAVRDLVAKAMQAGMTPSGTRPGIVDDTPEEWLDIADKGWIELGRDSEQLVAQARIVLKKNVNAAMDGVISFDDQVYMSSLFGGVFPRFPLVIADEFQDLNPLNHVQIAKVAGLDGRYIVCGDKKQAIYAFRGADSDSMGSFRKQRDRWIDLPLATTFRCPREVVLRQQVHAPGFTAAPQAPQGVVIGLPLPTDGTAVNGNGIVTDAPPAWGWKDVIGAVGNVPTAILCRNNAPLLSMAFKLIRQGIGVQMLGRDIGKGLVALSRKIDKEDNVEITVHAGRIDEWMQKEASLARVNDNEAKVAGITDRGECLLAVAEAEGVRDSGSLRARLTNLFDRQSGAVVLSTGHRAKGLEWPTVLHLDPHRIPSKYAQRNPKQMEQERNLLYVIETRTKHSLINAKLEDYEV